MNNLIIKRSQIVEAIINGTPATGVRYYFTDIPNLAANNLRLYGLEGFSSAQLATTPTGYTVVGTTTGIVVTLRDTNKGNVVLVKFGDPNMEIKRDNPERRKAFRSRHNCDNPGPKWRPRIS